MATTHMQRERRLLPAMSMTRSLKALAVLMVMRMLVQALILQQLR